MSELLLPLIGMALDVHTLARTVIPSFWELIALCKNLANLYLMLMWTWDTPAKWFPNLVRDDLDKSYNAPSNV